MGKQNSVADPLSRREDLLPEEGEIPRFEPFPEDRIKPLEELEMDEISLEELEDVALALLATDRDIQEEIRQWTRDREFTLKGKRKEEGLWIQNERIWVPPDQEIRRRLVELYHDSPFTGHLGIAGTMNLVEKGYYWEGMQQYIRDYVSRCRICFRAKKRNRRRHGTLNALQYPRDLGSGQSQITLSSYQNQGI